MIETFSSRMPQAEQLPDSMNSIGIVGMRNVSMMFMRLMMNAILALMHMLQITTMDGTVLRCRCSVDDCTETKLQMLASRLLLPLSMQGAAKG